MAERFAEAERQGKVIDLTQDGSASTSVDSAASVGPRAGAGDDGGAARRRAVAAAARASARRTVGVVDAFQMLLARASGGASDAPARGGVPRGAYFRFVCRAQLEKSSAARIKVLQKPSEKAPSNVFHLLGVKMKLKRGAPFSRKRRESAAGASARRTVGVVDASKRKLGAVRRRTTAAAARASARRTVGVVDAFQMLLARASGGASDAPARGGVPRGAYFRFVCRAQLKKSSAARIKVLQKPSEKAPSNVFHLLGAKMKLKRGAPFSRKRRESAAGVGASPHASALAVGPPRSAAARASARAKEALSAARRRHRDAIRCAVVQSGARTSTLSSMRTRRRRRTRRKRRRKRRRRRRRTRSWSGSSASAARSGGSCRAE
jgi:hypothetical protein